MLARQILSSSLAVALPGTLALGAVTLYVLATLGAVDKQLAEIMRSLQATRELQLAVGRAERRLISGVLLGDERGRTEFDLWISAAETHLASCASAPCHGVSRTPQEMAGLLGPAMERLKRDGHSILEREREGAGTGRVAIEAVDLLIAGMDDELDHMSRGLARRVDDLNTRVISAKRTASLLTASLTAVIVMVASGVSIALARRIARPLRELLAGTRRIMAGDWRHRVQAGRSGEIADLAASFNAMMAELCDHRDRLEEHTRTLEKRVDERSRELRKTERALDQAERLASMGRLAGGVADRLSNPLTSIMMTAGLLMEEAPADSPLWTDLQKVTAEARRCSHAVDELRLFAGPVMLHKAPSSVRAVIERALASTRRELESRGVRVERDLDPDLPEMEWDADQMVQVLVSLCMNAAQAMPDGGQMRIRARPANGWLVLEIHDTGTGIPAAHRLRIFDPFFTTKPDGTGLGLAISQRIVRDHGGEIEIDSRTRDETGETGNAGTSVRVVLPIAPSQATNRPLESGSGST